MFFKVLVNSINIYHYIEYSINLKSDKVSRIDFIYNISRDKLIAIREYLLSTLEKG